MRESLNLPQVQRLGMNEVPVVEWPLIEDYSAELKSSIDTSYKSKVEEVMAITDRAERSEKQYGSLRFG